MTSTAKWGGDVKRKKLTIKQKKFADAYIRTGNAYHSAIGAGYSESYSRGNVIKLLENVSVKAYIDEKMQEIEDRQIAKAEEVLKHLTSVMRGEVSEEVVVVESTGDYESRARIVNKQVAAKERIRAAELLGRRYTLFTDKVEVDGNVGAIIIDDVPDEDE